MSLYFLKNVRIYSPITIQLLFNYWFWFNFSLIYLYLFMIIQIYVTYLVIYKNVKKYLFDFLCQFKMSQLEFLINEYLA